MMVCVSGISVGRQSSQDWIVKARQLAGDLSNNPEGHQRYATFHVELLIDQDGEVRRTKVRHYQTDTEESWPGWDQEKLLAVFRGQSALDTSSGAMPAPLRAPAPSAAPPPVHFEGPRPAEDGSGRNFRLGDQPTSGRVPLGLVWAGAIGDTPLDVVPQLTAQVGGCRNLH